MHDLATFIEATNRDSDTGSVIFADVGGSKVTAVLDFHQAGRVPRWGQDRIEYGFTISPQLAAWKRAADKPMDQKKKSDVKTPDGAPVAVPQCFALEIPILCGKEATPYTIAVRLRYEVTTR